jgi:hypothetical protein
LGYIFTGEYLKRVKRAVISAVFIFPVILSVPVFSEPETTAIDSGQADNRDYSFNVSYYFRTEAVTLNIP